MMPVDMPPDVPALIQRCAPNVAVQTFRPLLRVESANRPHAIGYKIVATDGAVYHLATQPRDAAEAKSWATWFLANGYRFDAGIAQVNTVNFKSTGLTPENMFDPCASIRAGAKVLADCYGRAVARFGDEQAALRAAFSCYQSGNFKTGFATGYVSRILSRAGERVDIKAPSGMPPLLREGSRATRQAAGGSAGNLYAVSSEVPGWSSPAKDSTSEPSE